MQMKLIKQYLAINEFDNEKPFLILDDLTGPVGMANGHVIQAKSRGVRRDWSELQVAEAIQSDADWAALYEAVDTGHPETITLRLAYGKFDEIGLQG